MTVLNLDTSHQDQQCRTRVRYPHYPYLRITYLSRCLPRQDQDQDQDQDRHQSRAGHRRRAQGVVGEDWAVMRRLCCWVVVSVIWDLDQVMD